MPPTGKLVSYPRQYKNLSGSGVLLTRNVTGGNRQTIYHGPSSETIMSVKK